MRIFEYNCTYILTLHHRNKWDSERDTDFEHTRNELTDDYFAGFIPWGNLLFLNQN